MEVETAEDLKQTMRALEKEIVKDVVNIEKEVERDVFGLKRSSDTRR